MTSTPAGISCGGTCSASFSYGSSVTLSASPYASSTFTGWSGGGCSGTDSCTIALTADTSVTATFTKKTFTVTPSAGSGGTISPSTAQTVNYGSAKSFTVTPNSGYTTSMGGTCGGTPTTGTVQFTYTTNAITANCTVTANFSCPNQPVRTVGAATQYYPTLQAAYNAAANGDTIQAQAMTFVENLTVNRNISVTLQGGYDCGYTTNSGSVTSLKGMIQSFAGGGTLTIANFNLVQ